MMNKQKGKKEKKKIKRRNRCKCRKKKLFILTILLKYGSLSRYLMDQAT